jgi:UDP-GlcNAc:undecaprenyl-phosphate/decaprenyl-phosphate GlcNAc-1-phosphate transferase
LTILNYFSTFSIPLWILAVLGFLIAFSISYVAIPSIVSVARIKGLCAPLNARTSHKSPTPTLGGVSIFAGFILATILVGGTYFNTELSYIIAGLVVIFFVGIKDDILIIDAWKKLVGQILAASIIAILGNIRISNLHEIFDIGDIPYITSIIITVFVFVVIINGFNLIDGIDGLAAGVGILTSSVLGLWFFFTDNIAFTIMSFAFTGTLVAFIRFNVFSKKFKIFLGDTGSLITGLILCILVVRFLQLEPNVKGFAIIESTPAVAIGLFFIPLFDTIRVFTIRIAKGKSPFNADRQHIHHRLLDLGFNHLQSTSILLSINLVIILLCYLLRNLGNIVVLGILLGLAIPLSRILVVVVRKRKRKVIESEYAMVERYRVIHKMKKLLNTPTKVTSGALNKELRNALILNEEECFEQIEENKSFEENRLAENLFKHRFRNVHRI